MQNEYIMADMNPEKKISRRDFLKAAATGAAGAVLAACGVSTPTQPARQPTATEVAPTATKTETKVAPTTTLPPTVIPTKTEVPTTTATQTPTKTEVPTETQTPTLTPKQENQLKNAPIYYEKIFSMTPGTYTLSFDKDGLLLATDNISGRVIAKENDFVYNNSDNTTGKDQLPDGTWVFNNNLKERLSGDLDKTGLKPINGARNDPSSAVQNYLYKMNVQWFAKDRNLPYELVGGVAQGEYLVSPMVLLYKFPDGTYAWGEILCKWNKTTGLIESKRYLIYETASKEVKYIPIYFPDYLINH